MTCRHSSRRFISFSSSVCCISTLSLTCLFVASPPNTPVTRISKPGAGPGLCFSTLCRCSGLLAFFFLRSDLCSKPLVNAFLDVSPTYFPSHPLHTTSYVTPSLLHIPPSPSPQTIHFSESLHMRSLNGSDFCKRFFRLDPGTSDTPTLTLAACMTSWYLLFSSPPGVAGTNITVSFPLFSSVKPFSFLCSPPLSSFNSFPVSRSIEWLLTLCVFLQHLVIGTESRLDNLCSEPLIIS